VFALFVHAEPDEKTLLFLRCSYIDKTLYHDRAAPAGTAQSLYEPVSPNDLL
jgi:hypothetical protein